MKKIVYFIEFILIKVLFIFFYVIVGHAEIAAAFINATDILQPTNAMAILISSSMIRFDRSFKTRSTTLKQINCNATAIEPHIIISAILTLEARHTASGIATPMQAPRKEIEAAIFPFFIRSSSFIGVTLVYNQRPIKNITIAVEKWEIKNGKPLFTL